MEECKQAKKVFSRLGWSYIAGTAAVYLLQGIAVVVISLIDSSLLDSMTVNLLLSGITVYAVGMPLILLLASGMEREPIERHKMKWWQYALALIMCYSLMYVSNILGTMVTTVIGVLKGSDVENNVASYVTNGNMLLNFVLMVVIAPIVEEYVFRKVIVDRTVRYGQGMAIAASGIMFGLFHGNLNQFAYAVGLGAFFAFLYIKTGNIKITMTMHAIINFMGSMVAGWLLKAVDFDKLNEVVSADSPDLEAMTALLMDNLGGWMLLALYGMLLFGVVIAGIVLFIVFFKRFKLEPGRVEIPKGWKLDVLFANTGMLTFCVIWGLLIILQLLF